jgi:hypothetical protein
VLLTGCATNVKTTLNGWMSALISADQTRVVTISDAGTLSVEADNADTETNDEKYVLAGRSLAGSEFVASFELTAQNEGIEIEDMTLNVIGDPISFAQGAQEVVIYADDKTTVLFSETVAIIGEVDLGKVEFNNINLIVEQGSMNIYVKVLTDPIGFNENGEET